MKVSRIIAFTLIAIAILMTATGGAIDIFGASPVRRCACGCPMCSGGRCAASLYGGPCPCNKGLHVSKQHLWHDGLFLMLIAIVLLVAF